MGLAVAEVRMGFGWLVGVDIVPLVVLRIAVEVGLAVGALLGVAMKVEVLLGLEVKVEVVIFFVTTT